MNLIVSLDSLDLCLIKAKRLKRQCNFSICLLFESVWIARNFWLPSQLDMIGSLKRCRGYAGMQKRGSSWRSGTPQFTGLSKQHIGHYDSMVKNLDFKRNHVFELL